VVTHGAERAEIDVDVGILGERDESRLTLRYYRIGE
jgi:hypothetical protein